MFTADRADAMETPFLFVDDIDTAGKRCLVRFELDVPLVDGAVGDDDGNDRVAYDYDYDCDYDYVYDHDSDYDSDGDDRDDDDDDNNTHYDDDYDADDDDDDDDGEPRSNIMLRNARRYV